MSSRHKLKSYQPNKVFIHPDEPLEARRKSTLARLQRKFESEGMAVVVANGSLTVDDVPVFSLENGFINRSDE